MALIRWNPWNMSSLLDDDFELPTSFSRIIGQGLNLYETEDELVAEASMPGIADDNIDITIDNNIVRITGKSVQTQDDEGKKKYYMSSMASAYNYSFRLPEGLVAGEEPVAELEHGVLKLHFKKVAKTEPKKVKVVSKTK